MGAAEKAVEAAIARRDAASERLPALVRAAHEAKTAREAPGERDRKRLKQLIEDDTLAAEELAAGERELEASSKALAGAEQSLAGTLGGRWRAELAAKLEPVKEAMRRRLGLLRAAEEELGKAQAPWAEYCVLAALHPEEFPPLSPIDTPTPDRPRVLAHVEKLIEAEAGIQRDVIYNVPGLNGLNLSAIDRVNEGYQRQDMARAEIAERPLVAELSQEQQDQLLWVLYGDRGRSAPADLGLHDTGITIEELKATAGLTEVAGVFAKPITDEGTLTAIVEGLPRALALNARARMGLASNGVPTVPPPEAEELEQWARRLRREHGVEKARLVPGADAIHARQEERAREALAKSQAEYDDAVRAAIEGEGLKPKTEEAAT